MEDRDLMRTRWTTIAEFLRPVGLTALAGLVLGGLFLASLYSYLLFHSLVELFSIIVACAIFVIAWNSRRFWDNGCFLLLGIAYLFVGAADLIHTLAYKGMGVFSAPGSDLATRLWIVARYIESGSLLIAPLFLRRRLNAHGMLLGFAIVFGVSIWSIFAGHFPHCYVEGVGLTAFKKNSEYVICVFFAAGGGLLLLNRRRFEGQVLAMMIASLAVSILSELSFTLYVGVYGLLNLIGHLLKLVSFYLLYRAIIHTALAKPYDLLFRELKRAEAGLREARDQLERRVAERTAELRKTVDRLEAEVRERLEAEERLERERRTLFSVLQMLPGFVALRGEDCSFRFVNDKFLELFGDPGHRPCHEVMRGRDRPCQPCAVARVYQTGLPTEWEWTGDRTRVFHTWGYPFTDLDGTKLSLLLGIDITERKRLEHEVLRVSEAEKQRIGQDLHDSLGQILTGVSCLSQVLHRKLAAKSLREAEDAARIESLLADSVSLTRSLARGLSPVGLEPGSLMVAMKELASNLEEVFGQRCLFRCDRPVLVKDGVAAKHLYRIAQEAANNAFRHGQAKRVVIELAEPNGQIVLTVSDDGLGLPDEAERHPGMGLRTMTHRAHSIGGDLDIQRGPQEGTVVTCRLRKAGPGEA